MALKKTVNSSIPDSFIMKILANIHYTKTPEFHSQNTVLDVMNIIPMFD